LLGSRRGQLIGIMIGFGAAVAVQTPQIAPAGTIINNHGAK